jgi:nitrite reductase (NO-forming)/hydroxylamine reductase
VCITSDVSPDKVGPYFVLALKEAGQMWRIDWSQSDFPVDKLEGVGNILHDRFLSPDNTRFYIASQVDNWMAVVDVGAWELVETIPTGQTPHSGSDAAWEANGTVYGATVHAGEGRITVWDLSNNESAAEIETSGLGLFLRSHHDSPYVWADIMFGDPPNRIYVLDAETFEDGHL